MDLQFIPDPNGSGMLYAADGSGIWYNPMTGQFYVPGYGWMAGDQPMYPPQQPYPPQYPQQPYPPQYPQYPQQPYPPQYPQQPYPQQPNYAPAVPAPVIGGGGSPGGNYVPPPPPAPTVRRQSQSGLSFDGSLWRK